MPRQRKTGLDWVAMMCNAPSNEKFVRIAAMLNISHDAAFGLYVKFLCWVGQHHPTGDLTGVEDTEINHATGWRANPEDENTFASVLRSDRLHILYTTRRARVRLNGWNELNGRFWQELLRERKRMERRRKTAGNPAADQGNAGGTRPIRSDPDRSVTVKEQTPGKEPAFASEHPAYQIAQTLLDAIRSHSPNYKQPNMQQWARHADLMLRLDGRTVEAVAEVINWVHCEEGAGPSFWRPNILSTKKLRSQFDRLAIKMKGAPDGQPGKDRPTGPRHFARDTDDLPRYTELDKAARARMARGNESEGGA